MCSSIFSGDMSYILINLYITNTINYKLKSTSVLLLFLLGYNILNQQLWSPLPDAMKIPSWGVKEVSQSHGALGALATHKTHEPDKTHTLPSCFPGAYNGTVFYKLWIFHGTAACCTGHFLVMNMPLGQLHLFLWVLQWTHWLTRLCLVRIVF